MKARHREAAGITRFTVFNSANNHYYPNYETPSSSRRFGDAVRMDRKCTADALSLRIPGHSGQSVSRCGRVHASMRPKAHLSGPAAGGATEDCAGEGVATIAGPAQQAHR